MSKPNTIIVTRHPSLVELIIERGIATADTPVIEHPSPDDVRDRHVVGVLPLHLAALAESVTEIEVAMTPQDRADAQFGDLSLARLREIAGPARTFVARTAE